jgi:type VI secretion system protein ImpF
MHAFRASAAARDSKAGVDVREEDGLRLVASRRAVITESLLRREVAMDLGALMNTIALGSSIDLSSYEHVQRSILNFGLPDIVHRALEENPDQAIADEIRTALVNFEPRLVASSIAVARDESVDAKELKLRFNVRADLFCDPINVPVEFMADVELDNGKIVINRL